MTKKYNFFRINFLIVPIPILMYCLFPRLQSKRFINRVPTEFKNYTLLVFDKLHMNVLRII